MEGKPLGSEKAEFWDMESRRARASQRIIRTELMYTIHTNPVRNSQETHYDSATKAHRLMLFRETVRLL
jgi:hypothetical protein